MKVKQTERGRDGRRARVRGDNLEEGRERERIEAENGDSRRERGERGRVTWRERGERKERGEKLGRREKLRERDTERKVSGWRVRRREGKRWGGYEE